MKPATLRTIHWLWILGSVAVATPALGAPIPVDVTLTGNVSYDVGSSSSSANASHGGQNFLVVGGSTTTTTFADGAIGAGANPLLGTFTDTGDSVGISASGATSASGSYLGEGGFDLFLTNSSATDTYEVLLGLSYAHSVDADGASALTSSQLTIDDGTTQLFGSTVLSDLLGDALNGVGLGSFGAVVSDSGNVALSVVLDPGTTVTVSGDWSGSGQSPDPGASTTATFGSFLSINEVNSVVPVPEPGTGLLVTAGVLGIAGWRKREA